MNRLRDFLRRLLKRNKSKRKLLAILDLDNLCGSLPRVGKEAIRRMFEKISREIAGLGEVSAVFVLGTFSNIFGYSDEITESGFFPIMCPEKKDKRDPRKIINQTDEVLIRFGQQMLGLMPETSLLLVSGDRDFQPLISRARQLDRNINVAVASTSSLAAELVRSAKNDPKMRIVVLPRLPEI